MRTLTAKEAVEMIEEAWNLDGESHRVNETIFEVTLLGSTVSEAQDDIDMFALSLGIEIDPDSITISPDNDDQGVGGAVITIRANGGSA